MLRFAFAVLFMLPVLPMLSVAFEMISAKDDLSVLCGVGVLLFLVAWVCGGIKYAIHLYSKDS